MAVDHPAGARYLYLIALGIGFIGLTGQHRVPGAIDSIANNSVFVYMYAGFHTQSIAKISRWK